jgi:hypothetical protein
MWNKGTDPLILNLGNYTQLHALAALPSGKKSQYSFSRWLGGPQSRSGCFGEEKNLLPLPIDRQIQQIV